VKKNQFEDTKGGNQNPLIEKDIQHNGTTKGTSDDIQNITHKTKDRVKQTH
jgi:hypothetical protein